MADGEFRLLFELAQIIHCTVEELGERMSSHEMSWWRAYFHVKDLERGEAKGLSGDGSGSAGGPRSITMESSF